MEGAVRAQRWDFGSCTPALSLTPSGPGQARSPPPRGADSGAQMAKKLSRKAEFYLQLETDEGGAFILRDGAHLVHQRSVSW